MPVQKLHLIQPDSQDASPHDAYVRELKTLIDGPEEVVNIQMLDAPIPMKPILLVITNLPDGRRVEKR